MLREEQLRTLLRATEGRDFVSRRDHAILLLFMDSGRRRAELAGLHVDDIDLDLREAYVTGKADRSGPPRLITPSTPGATMAQADVTAHIAALNSAGAVLSGIAREHGRATVLRAEHLKQRDPIRHTRMGQRRFRSRNWTARQPIRRWELRRSIRE